MKYILTITEVLIISVLILSTIFVSKLSQDSPIPPVKEETKPVIVESVQPEIVKVAEVKEIPSIKKLAQDKLNDLLSTGYWSHTNSNGCDFTCRTKPYWNYYSWIGENLYRGVCSEDNAYRLWRESPSHLEVLQHPYTEEVLLKQIYEENHCYMVLIRGIKK